MLKKRLGWGLFLGLFLSLEALAATVRPQSPEELALKAPIVLYGEVVKIDVDSGTGYRTALVEKIELGHAPAEFRNRRDFRVPLLDRAIPRSDLLERVSSAPNLVVGEKVVLFLKPVAPELEGPFRQLNGEELFTLMGLYQGKMRVLEDLEGQRHVVAWNEIPESVLSNAELRAQKTTLRQKLSPMAFGVRNAAVKDLRLLSHLLDRARAAGGN